MLLGSFLPKINRFSILDLLYSIFYIVFMFGLIYLGFNVGIGFQIYHEMTGNNLDQFINEPLRLGNIYEPLSPEAYALLEVMDKVSDITSLLALIVILMSVVKYFIDPENHIFTKFKKLSKKLGAMFQDA